MLAARESAELAEQFIADTIQKHNIEPGTLTLHADRGTSMRSKPVAALLIDLDVNQDPQPPTVSDDNPYSEAQFKTLKYRPDFPDASVPSRTHVLTARNSSVVQRCASSLRNCFDDTEAVHHGTAATLTQQRANTLSEALPPIRSDSRHRPQTARTARCRVDQSAEKGTDNSPITPHCSLIS